MCAMCLSRAGRQLLRIKRRNILALSKAITANNQVSYISTTVNHRNINYQQQQQQQQHSGHDQLKVFKDNATKWWSGKEFSILRSMNEIRVPFVVNGIGKPMSESRILDVGCGGGILSEPLARLGANVLGIDPVFESINQAQIHSQIDTELKDRLKYRNCNIEDLTSQPEHVEVYDALVASEVLEHIEDVENFLIHCSKAIKPNGSLFITTINQTPLSWLGVIFFGEYVLQQLPKGTHTYDLFVNVKGLRVMLERLGFHIKLVNGFMYEPIGGKFYWTPTTLTHYALQAVKTRPLAKGINYEQRRHMAKMSRSSAASSSPDKKLKRPKRILDDDDMALVIPIDAFNLKVEAVMSEFKDHLTKNLTTRTSTASIEKLKIQIEGLNESLELKDIAQISMKGANLICINLSTMPEAVRPTMQALSELGNLTPQAEVNNIFLPIPRVTGEYREQLVLVAKQAANSARAKLRSIFSEYSAKAKHHDQRAGVSIDLVRDTIETIQYGINKRLLEIEQLLTTRTNLLLNKRGQKDDEQQRFD